MAEDAQRRATNRHRRFARPLFPPGGIGARDMGGGVGTGKMSEIMDSLGEDCAARPAASMAARR